jgi:ubiquitin-like protein Pup
MSEQTFKNTQSSKTEEADVVAPVPTESIADQELMKSTDDLLDEIDTLLEPNAQEFVDGFVQKGGE